MSKASILIGCMLVAVCGAPAVAHAGRIRGTLRVPDPGSAAEPAAAVTDAVIYVEQIPARLEKKLARRSGSARVEQASGGFVPRVLAVGPGTRVRFENRGDTWHNVFSVSPAHAFDIGKYGPRESREVRFDRPGAVPLFCDLDPDETGFVFVAPNHAFARPDRGGAFALPALPRGTYRIVAWHPRFGRVARDVAVPRRGEATLALKL